MHELPDLSQLTSEQKDELIRQLFPLVAQVRWLSARVAELEARLSKGSHNSSKPPSSDGLAKKTQSLRQPSGRRAGGQAGHPGRTLERTALPDKILHHRLPDRCACGASLSESDARIAERRQVFDIPVQRYQVVEHRTLQLRCTCGREHVSGFPTDVTEAVQYGPNVRALGVHLTQGQLLPYARAAELIADLFQLEVSPGTLVTWVGQAGARLQPTVATIAADLRQAKVVGTDESGLRVSAKLHWLHTVVTPTHTWYGVHAKRGMEAIVEHAILTEYQGTAVHDCWKPYWRLDCVHALCNAHLLRELVFIRETTGQVWPQRMTDVLLAANDACLAARATNADTLPSPLINALVTQYRAVLDEGQASHPEVSRQEGQRGKVKQSPAFNLLSRLRKHEEEVLRFVRDLTVPFTNNLAERAIRMPKVKQKISGSFRSFKGAENFAVIRSYLDTMRKQGHRMHDALRSVFAGKILQPASG